MSLILEVDFKPDAKFRRLQRPRSFTDRNLRTIYTIWANYKLRDSDNSRVFLSFVTAVLKIVVSSGPLSLSNKIYVIANVAAMSTFNKLRFVMKC